jgi:signal transduction histidine kinase/PAS domain-containing protein
LINETGARSIGQARETMLDRVLWDVFPEAVGSEFERAYRTAMTDGVATTVEAFYPPLNAWFEARAFPYGDGMSVFFRDITERRSIEQALRENQADLNWAQAVGRIGSWRLNIQRNELLWSDENHRIFGLPKGAPMSYETFLGVVHPEDREYVDRKWQAALRGEPYDIVHRLVVGNAVKWVRERAELEFDADGKLLGGFGITQDITEHKLADDALRESEARFRLLARTAEELLTARHPQEHIDALAARVMTQLDCQCFFNFLVAGGQPGRLKLNAWAGIPEKEARRIEWLDYGVAVCGCVARDGVRIVAEHIPTTPDVRTELVKSYGIKAYACHPLVGVNGRVLGTLSFGTRSRETFSADDLALMKAVADQVAVALVRMQNERDLRNSAEALQEANERLEEKVSRRTRALEDTVATLKNEILVRKKIQAQLHHLSRKSLEALEADRRTVARELHDSIGGSLAAIKFGLEEAAERAGQDPACAGQSIGVLISHLADTIKETKRISANLRPLAIDDLGLLATIEWYTRQFCQRYETIRVVCQIDVEEQEIPEEFKIVLYRIMQEALTNVSRHSQADAVTVRLTKSATHFEFEVEDNGCGFDTSSVFGGPDRLSGYGLKSMQERAEICGGILNVRTRPNSGTSVKVSLPFSAASGFSASEADLAANHAAAGRQM